MENVNYNTIMQLLPHRYPFLLVDRVEDIILGEQAVGIKNVSLNEQVFQGHFPKDPVFPGVLIVESMAQTAAVLALLTQKKNQNEVISDSIYFMTIDQVKFRQQVHPGDVMKLHIKKEQRHSNVWKFSGEAFVQDRLVAQANFMAMMR